MKYSALKEVHYYVQASVGIFNLVDQFESDRDFKNVTASVQVYKSDSRDEDNGPELSS